MYKRFLIIDRRIFNVNSFEWIDSIYRSWLCKLLYVSVSLLYESFWKVINYFYFEVMNFMIYILCCELFEIWCGMFGFVLW